MENTFMDASDVGTSNKRQYICGVCGISRSKRALIDLHMNTHSDCHAKFFVKGRDQRRYTCTFCGIVRSKLSLLRKHMECHTDRLHDWCKAHLKCSMNPETVKEWLFEMSRLSTQKSCILKQKIGDDSDKKLNVMRTRAVLEWGLSRKSWFCQFATPDPIRTPQKRFVCTMDGCNKCYKRRYHLKRHLLRHEGVVFSCPRKGCIMKCSNLSNLRRHLKLHSLKGDLQRGRERVETKEKLYQCPRHECGKSFAYPSQLERHEENAHSLNYMDIVCGEVGCGLHFSTVSLLKEHLKCAHKYINCNICGTSSLRRCYKRHLHIHESNLDSNQEKKRLHCMIEGCKQSYSSISNLIQHLRVGHQNLKPFKCSFEGCNMAFSYKHVRDNHESRKHYYEQGDFHEEDRKFRLRPRGGQKPVSLENIEDLFRKRTKSNGRSECTNGFSYEEWIFLREKHDMG